MTNKPVDLDRRRGMRSWYHPVSEASLNNANKAQIEKILVSNFIRMRLAHLTYPDL
jgi:hypothetical protein